MKIKVRWKHIKKGKVDLTACPIALAAKEQLGLPWAHVMGGAIYYNSSLYYYHIPKKADIFIQRFDKGKKVKPFSFVAKLTPKHKWR